MSSRPSSIHSMSSSRSSSSSNSDRDPNTRYDRYRISTQCQQSWSESQKLLTIAALSAMLAESRTQSSSSERKNWNVYKIRFSPSAGKPKQGSEIFRKVDSRLQ